MDKSEQQGMSEATLEGWFISEKPSEQTIEYVCNPIIRLFTLRLARG